MGIQLRGNGGSFSGAGIGIGKIKTWSASLDPGIVDVSGFGDLGYGASDSTIGRITGSASGFVDTVTAPIAATAFGSPFLNSAWSLAIVLTMSAGKTYSFTALVSLNINAIYSDHVELTINYTSTGVIVAAWA